VGTREIRVRFWASARSAAGTDAMTVTLDAPEPTVADVRRAVVAALPGQLELPRVLDVCSVLLGERPMGAADAEQVPVPAGTDLEFLPPFAGG
jgi:molybdopterin converting factor small subunit